VVLSSNLCTICGLSSSLCTLCGFIIQFVYHLWFYIFVVRIHTHTRAPVVV
jgi:hypothetical protein